SQLTLHDGSEELTYVHSAKFPKSVLVVYLSPNFKSDTNVTCGSNSYKNEPSSSEEEFLEETWLVGDSLHMSDAADTLGEISAADWSRLMLVVNLALRAAFELMVGVSLFGWLISWVGFSSRTLDSKNHVRSLAMRLPILHIIENKQIL